MRLKYNFIDTDDFMELTELFDNLVKYRNDPVFGNEDKFNEYIKEIDIMINYLNGFQKCVLK
jgi:hypothetical protein